MNDNRQYPDVQRFAAKLGIPPEKLIRVFEIERDFHIRILREDDADKRKEMYREVYESVHRIYGTLPAAAGTLNPKDRIVRIFRKELSGKSILEVGCGNGLFLQSVARLLPHGELVGLDISAPVLPSDGEGIRFVRADVIDFTVPKKFDVVFSEHVIEHIAPGDLPAHLNSVTNALAEGGVLIVCAPNGNFGPSDVTRILDRSHSGKTAAMGTHLHEPTHRDLMETLKNYGFNSFRTIFPFMKVRNYLGFMRFNAGMAAFVERNRALMGFLRAIRYKGECIARFDTVLICRRG
ncbi:MAG TPA: class I SAM-dependent methyltransferase [Geobacteraceae bacterium]|nr:class I SAM-dependent methyltransferase [Geobacteraceae bacterium]